MKCKTCGQNLKTRGSMVAVNVVLTDVHYNAPGKLSIDSKTYKTDSYLLKCQNCKTLLSSVFTAEID